MEPLDLDRLEATAKAAAGRFFPPWRVTEDEPSVIVHEVGSNSAEVAASVMERAEVRDSFGDLVCRVSVGAPELAEFIALVDPDMVLELVRRLREQDR